MHERYIVPDLSFFILELCCLIATSGGDSDDDLSGNHEGVDFELWN